MSYYPLSQIKTNLYTNGNELYNINTLTSYTGYYYKTSDGKYYTGRTPKDLPTIQLIYRPSLTESFLTSSLNEQIPFTETSTTLITDYPKYNYQITLLPYYSPTLPTQQDYQIGEFQRYFCKKTNEILYIEINQEQFDKLVGKDPQIEFSLYQPFTITWILTGDKQQVAKTNKNIVELASVRQKLPKFDQYLKFDYTKYFQ